MIICGQAADAASEVSAPWGSLTPATRPLLAYFVASAPLWPLPLQSFELQIAVAFEFLDRLEQVVADVAEAVAVVDFLAVGVGDVKHIHHLIEMGGDLGEDHREAQPENRAGGRVEQAGAVVGEDVDNRRAGRGVVVDRHPRGQLGKVGRIRQLKAGVAFEQRLDFGFPLERLWMAFVTSSIRLSGRVP